MTTTELRVTQPRVLTSEWIKLRSLRSTVYTLIASAGMTIGLGVLFSIVTTARWDHMRPEQKAHFDPTTLTTQGYFLAQLAVGVLGVLLITGEYSTGMIRATLSAVPHRLPVLWAKIAVFAVVAVIVSVASAFVAFFAGQAVLSTKHLNVAITAPHELRVVVGTGLYLVVVGVLGMALGFIIRNTAGAITALFGIILILPVIGEIMASWINISPYLPSNAGSVILTTHPDPGSLAPWTGFALFLAYTVVAIGAAAVTLRRRDA
jgi:ABC-type transport system involved in multi-copper enzyme maturation permease subunit